MVVTYELPDHFLALPPAGLDVAVEEELAEMVAGECSECPCAIGVGQTFLEDGEAAAVLVLAVDGQVTIKIGFE